ncbi:hypothetical protein GSI_04911 [Ganoderma sinense ZZ0214-1]|uniref:Uncharacterized protein n=1 Tax=Ganoderma sinense ZZ0214-1 TaxID=1077348 RepID=A0A2G8SG99_9APHY|nr:hypothetical protein GSI_04911 [Ganoderma sinense ZZ0214-1]
MHKGPNGHTAYGVRTLQFSSYQAIEPDAISPSGYLLSGGAQPRRRRAEELVYGSARRHSLRGCRSAMILVVRASVRARAQGKPKIIFRQIGY